jgi:hypothetical protein
MEESLVLEQSRAISGGTAFRQLLDNDPQLRTDVAHRMQRFAEFADALLVESSCPELQAQAKRAREFIDEILKPIREVENIDDAFSEWKHLARIVGMPEDRIESGEFTASQVWRELLAWHANKVASGRATAKAISGFQTDYSSALIDPHEFHASDNSPSAKFRVWKGARDWFNWGIGEAAEGDWHLFHYIVDGSLASKPRWIHHKDVRVAIAPGKEVEIAKRFAKTGVMTVSANHPRHYWATAVSLLADRIKGALSQVRMKCDSKPFYRFSKDRWQSRVRFGEAVNTEYGWRFYPFQEPESPRDPKEAEYINKLPRLPATRQGRTGRILDE